MSHIFVVTHLKKKWDCLFHSFEVFCIQNLGFFFKLLNNNQLSSSLCACVWQGQDYEIRTYQPTKWVSTSVSGMQLEAALSTGFRRLFNYIQGNNKNSEFHVTAITFTQGKLSLCCWGCASCLRLLFCGVVANLLQNLHVTMAVF